MASPLDYLNDPKVRQFLDGIAGSEGVKHGYNTIFGNERFGNLSAHPNVRKQFKQTDGKMNVTTAAGRYQFLKPTWDGLSRQYNLKDFSPQSQDIGAIGLIMQKGALSDVLKGNYQAAIQKLGSTWASLPSSPYAQPRKSWGQADRLFSSKGAIQAPQPERIKTVSWSQISDQSPQLERLKTVLWSEVSGQQAQPQRPQTVSWPEVSKQQQADSRPALVAWQDIAGG